MEISLLNGEGFGNGEGQFNFPYGIVVDNRGNVFAVDSGNMRIQQFMPAEDAEHEFKEEDVVAFFTGNFRFMTYFDNGFFPVRPTLPASRGLLFCGPTP